MQNAAHGTKTIYFDSNDLMYTEEEVLSGRVGKKSHLTKKGGRRIDRTEMEMIL